MRVGVTGHQDLARFEAEPWVESTLDRIIESLHRPVIGLSSLAAGADQVFAKCVIVNGGELHAIIPFPNYENRLTTNSEREAYLTLLAAATSRITLEWLGSDEASYLAAGRFIVDDVDLMIAVWDGEPAHGLGGTADIVTYARQMGKPVHHLNPKTRNLSLAVGSTPRE